MPNADGRTAQSPLGLLDVRPTSLCITLSVQLSAYSARRERQLVTPVHLRQLIPYERVCVEPRTSALKHDATRSLGSGAGSR